MTITNCNWTQLPNDFIDQGGIQLVGAPAACLYWCIARKTKGWQKEADAISYTELARLTGFARTTLSRAIDNLLKHGLILAQKNGGRTTFYSLRLSATSSGNGPVDESTSSGNGLVLVAEMDRSLTLNLLEEKDTSKDTTGDGIAGGTITKSEKLGTQAKECLDYYFQQYVERREFEPMIDGPRDMEIFKRILRADYTVAAVKQVIRFFFTYPKRTKFSTRDLYNSFDTLYGVLVDQAKGKRQ